MSKKLQSFLRNRPKLIALDLDGTVWSPDMYQLWGGGSPFRIEKDGTEKLKDCSGQTVRLLGDIGNILQELNEDDDWKQTSVAWVSCTDEPKWADECLRKFKTPISLNPIYDMAQYSEIYKSNKQTHFRQLKKQTGLEFEEMMFFDNEMGNIRNVSKLGVFCVYCPEGISRDLWNESLEKFDK